MSAIDGDKGGFFFLYGYGGTGKTFIWRTLSAGIRCKAEIVITVTSSGIASLLLSGGRTAHSRFLIPISITEDSICSIKPDSDLAALLRCGKLIIWDEAPMIYKHCFEVLDKSLKDILRSSDPNSVEKPFGGKVVILGGDFRQILPVIQKGSRQDIVDAAIKSSHLWNHCEVLKLTVNIRLHAGSSIDENNDIREFSKWILNVSDGKIAEPNDGVAEIEIPDDMLIKTDGNPINAVVNTVYSDVLNNLEYLNYLQQRAILARTHDDVNTINDLLLDNLPEEEVVYLSSGSICPSKGGVNTEDGMFTPDFLNSIKCSGLLHKLKLKKGTPVMLLRNVDQHGGLCNGTRLRILRLGQRVIEAKVISENYIGEVVYIPRKSLCPSDIIYSK